MFLYNLLFGRMFPRPYVATLSYIKQQRNVIMMTNECRFFFLRVWEALPLMPFSLLLYLQRQ